MGSGQAYGIGSQKDLGEGVYGMYAGDADANGNIDYSDKSAEWENDAGFAGYAPFDMNLDGQINNIDKNDYWLPNEGEGSQVPE